MKITKNSINISNIPFSRYGSYFVITTIKNKLIIKDIRGGDKDQGHVFEFKFYENVSVTMSETQVTVSGKSGELHLTFVNEDTLDFKGNLKLSLKYFLNKYDAICQLKKDFYEITSYSKEIKFGIKHVKGDFKIEAPWDTIGNTSIEIQAGAYYQFYVCSYKTVFTNRLLTSHSMGYQYHHWQALLPKDHTHASYITWMNFVKPEGQLKRYTMYMSKHWMTNVWSWDNCFSAIFLAHIDTDLALDQFLLFSDHQDRSGMYPDYMNNQYVSYSCAKPPIYGWAYEMMMKINPIYNNVTLLEKVYDTVSRLTNFWLEHRMSDLGLPFYVHGNESGWDNGTLFKDGVPLITADLSAFLIRQLDFLATITNNLGLTFESQRLTEKADAIYEKMMTLLWREDHFDAYLLCDEKYVDHKHSLQSRLPLIIHYRLPKDVVDQMIADLQKEDDFLTDYGFATEALSSPYYKSGGYWRGPIWAPIMLLLTSTFEELKLYDFLEVVVKRFFKTMQKNGMAENFDPEKGHGFDDPAFAWTSSVYLHYLIKYDFLKHD